jgi:hypothetical protein
MAWLLEAVSTFFSKLRSPKSMLWISLCSGIGYVFPARFLIALGFTPPFDHLRAVCALVFIVSLLYQVPFTLLPSLHDQWPKYQARRKTIDCLDNLTNDQQAMLTPFLNNDPSALAIPMGKMGIADGLVSCGVLAISTVVMRKDGAKFYALQPFARRYIRRHKKRIFPLRPRSL